MRTRCCQTISFGYEKAPHHIVSYTVWTEALIPVLEHLFDDPEKILKLAEEYKTPFIEEQQGNPIFESSLKLSQKIAEEVLINLDLDALVKEYSFKSLEEALVVTYHEILWDILEEMENQKLLTKPEVLTNPKQTEESNISQLIFLVHSPK